MCTWKSAADRVVIDNVRALLSGFFLGEVVVVVRLGGLHISMEMEMSNLCAVRRPPSPSPLTEQLSII